MDVVMQLKKARADVEQQLARELDSLALSENTDVAMWEHEDLAKVRIKVFRAHEGEVNQCHFFCDETRILSCSTDGSIKIWDPQLGTVVHSYDNAHEINTSGAYCRDDGLKLFSCGWDKKVIYWDNQTGTPLWTANHLDMLTCCHMSHDGRMACVGSDLYHEMYVYDLRTGNISLQIRDYHKSSLTSIHFTPDDSRLITTSADRTAKFYDLRSDNCTIKLEGHENVISSSSITQDQRKFATASWDKTINIWDIATGMYRSNGPLTLKGSHEGSILACDFADNGKQLVSGSADLGIVVWDVESGSKRLKLQGHTGWVTDVHFSKDCKWLLSCSKDSTVRMWNIEESDDIPLVIEQKKQKGIKVNKCSKCERPFSMVDAEDYRNRALCVFCRLQNPEESWLIFKDDPSV